MSFDFPAIPLEDQEYTPMVGLTYVYKSPRWLVKTVPPASSGGGTVEEAPMDGTAYGRRVATWVDVLMATGDIVDGGNYITSAGMF